MTPLMMAALNSARETARFLLAAGASTNVLDSYGCPALLGALESGDTVIAEWLAEGGVPTLGDDVHDAVRDS